MPQEIVIRPAARRVLNAFGCCDNGIDAALASLGEIRRLLVDRQDVLAAKPDRWLYLVIEFMLEGFRQFLTFDQRLRERTQAPQLCLPPSSAFRRQPDHREA